MNTLLLIELITLNTQYNNTFTFNSIQKIEYGYNNRIMFVKKQSAVQFPPISKQQLLKDSTKSKDLNHQFFLLVRDKKYEEAYTVGQIYLQFHPQNQAIQQFCYFIKNNREELLKMVDEQDNYTDGSSESQDQDDSDEQTESVSSLSSSSSKSTIKSKSIASSSSITSIKSNKFPPAPKTSTLGKQNTEICKGHKWNHNCKNVNCPNKKK